MVWKALSSSCFSWRKGTRRRYEFEFVRKAVGDVWECADLFDVELVVPDEKRWAVRREVALHHSCCRAACHAHLRGKVNPSRLELLGYYLEQQ
jgi:hypothetical protein